jgi:hypothetical protein
MIPNEPSTTPKYSFKKRILVLVSTLWIVVVLVVSLNVNNHRLDRYSSNRELDVVGFFSGFVIFGIVPLILAFGISWVAAAHRRKD